MKVVQDSTVRNGVLHLVNSHWENREPRRAGPWNIYGRRRISFPVRKRSPIPRHCDISTIKVFNSKFDLRLSP